MKIFLLYALMCISVGGFFSEALAQTDPSIYVKGTRASTIYDGIDFYGIDPSNAEYTNVYYYLPNLSFPSNSTVPTSATKTYKWTAVGGTVISNDDVETVSVKWNNVKNYNGATPSHTIRVKITFTWKTGQAPNETTHTKVIESIRANGLVTAQPIEVKFISPLTSITFAGNTFNSTGTLLYACGTTPQNLSVSAITTDPNVGVTLYFTYPVGWTGPASATGTSVSINPGIREAGTIKVEAKRNDSNFRVKISLNITRPLPLLGTVSVNDFTFCSPTQTITASATGTNATSFQWAPLSGGIKINGSASAQNVPGNVTIGTTSTGSYMIKAYSSSCQALSANSITRNAFFGPPPTPSGTVNGGPQQTPNVVPNGAFLVITPGPGQYSFNFAILQGTGYLYPNGGASANATPNPFIRVEGKVNNVCGSNVTIFYLSSTPMGGGFAMSPNPTTADEATISFEENSADSFLAKSAAIYDDKQQKIREYDFEASRVQNKSQSNKYKMDLKGISPGQYYVHLLIGDNVEKKILVIK